MIFRFHVNFPGCKLSKNPHEAPNRMKSPGSCLNLIMMSFEAPTTWRCSKAVGTPKASKVRLCNERHRFPGEGITDSSLETQQQTILLLLPPALKANKQLLDKSAVDVLLALSSLFSPAKIGCGFDICSTHFGCNSGLLLNNVHICTAVAIAHDLLPICTTSGGSHMIARPTTTERCTVDTT